MRLFFVDGRSINTYGHMVDLNWIGLDWIGWQGAIAAGNYADIVAWDPDVEFELDDDHPVYLKHRVSNQNQNQNLHLSLF